MQSYVLDAECSLLTKLRQQYMSNEKQDLSITFFWGGGPSLSYILLGPVLLGQTDVDEDRTSFSWVR